MVQSCHGRHFLLSLENINLGEGSQQYFTACWMIGSMKDAAEFVYNIFLDAYNRTLRWQSKPRSIRENISSFTNADFLVLNKHTVELFFEDGNLALNVVIRKVYEHTNYPLVVDTVDDCPPIVARARLDASSDLTHLLVIASSPLLSRDSLTTS
ncbi:GM11718 [Drosophila sechellia]|uniref:E3 ubiquitin-protein ligase n=1 Tax=Drosophila sechellia TaxID=7238 RepID=B4IQD0_DROSE|nr:GM11718 [Drosophila sechellia]